MHVFYDDDDGHVGWIRNNTTGLVLNVRRNPGANYTVLHHAASQTIPSQGAPRHTQSEAIVRLRQKRSMNFATIRAR